jgi:hypothetical protein
MEINLTSFSSNIFNNLEICLMVNHERIVSPIDIVSAEKDSKLDLIYKKLLELEKKNFLQNILSCQKVFFYLLSIGLCVNYFKNICLIKKG